MQPVQRMTSINGTTESYIHSSLCYNGIIKLIIYVLAACWSWRQISIKAVKALFLNISATISKQKFDRTN